MARRIKQLFVSYSRDDKHWTYEFAKALRDDLTYSAFVDYRNIHIGTDWWRTICENIEACDCAIYVMTPKSVESLYCRAEIDYLLALNKPILPIMLKSCTFPDELSRKRVQYLTISDEMQIDRVLLELQKGLEEVEYLLFDDPSPLPPRPDEPKPKDTKSAEEVFHLAADAAEEGQLEQAEGLFAEVVKADSGGRLGRRAQHRLDELRSYMQVARFTARQATLRDARELWREHWESHGREFDPLKLADKLAIPIHPPEKPAAASVTLAPIPKVTPDERLVAREGAPDSFIYPYLPEVELPDVYRGGFPELPIDLDEVGFIGDAGLTAEQRKMLAQNGFVVVPGHHSRFSSAYNSSGWTAGHDGKGSFMTTDALLNTLGQLFTSAQKDLDQGRIGSLFSLILIDVVTAAVAQWTMAAGTPLEEPARRAAVYYAVAALAMNDGTDSLPAPIRAAAEAIYVMIAAGQGTGNVQILTNYVEDFSQYRPRSYYADSTALSRYFRTMMWLGRITFRTADRIDTQTGLLAMRALAQYDVYERWTRVDDLLASFIGPSDDLGPRIVLPIMREVYGEDLPLAALADEALTDQVVARLLALPEPKINSRVREFPGNGPKHGLCIFGQRFTFDAYAMQILVYSNVGTRDRPRTLPMVEDVAAVLGSDLAFAVTDAAGATDFLHYTEYLGELREEANTFTAEAWQETLYGGWLSALQPLLVRTDTQYPPMMRADAWKYKDLNTFAGSYTQIKHATILYAKQVESDWLGMADSPPKPDLKPHHFVEPNPLVFARIAILAGTLRSSLRSVDGSGELTGLCADLVKLASKLAAEAARELRGEPILETNDGLFGDFTQFLEDVQEFLDPAWLDDDTDPFDWDTADGTVDIESDRDLPDWLRRASLGAAGDSGVSGAKPRGDGIIADIASDPNRGKVLYSAIGNVDTLWVVTDSPYGLQLTRGFVYSTYQFTGDIQSRLTDDDWRARVEAGDLPPRPSWSSTYMAP